MPKHQPQSSRRDELEDFKRRINLTEYAASLGYCIDRRASSRNSAVMVHPAGDKIIVAKGEDNHWVYISVRDDRDHGSIIDFHQSRQGLGRRKGESDLYVGAILIASPGLGRDTDVESCTEPFIRWTQLRCCLNSSRSSFRALMALILRTLLSGMC
jgi:hypothetical protein